MIRTSSSFKSQASMIGFLLLALLLSACSINPATGDRQFTALMSPAQENSVGATEHSKVVEQYGLYDDAKLNAYVNEVGQRVAKDTERTDVIYKFYIIDSPIVNAFALPGGYVYVSRGLLALAENEAQLAAVLGHEIGHITARHSAERYSHSVISSLGTGILSAAIGDDAISQALGVGSNLYLSSYSRTQENQADTLGIRYLDHAGYNPGALTEFLTNLRNNTALEAKIAGQNTPQTGYFSTHPATQHRINKTVQEASQFPNHDVFFKQRYFDQINGMTYGENAEQGFVRDQSFIHPILGFAFDAPDGYQIINRPTQIIVLNDNIGALAVFDFVANAQKTDILTYMQKNWMKGETLDQPENITINGMRAATGAFAGKVNGQAMTVRLVAIEWAPDKIARFQIGMPKTMNASQVNELKSLTYSFRRLNQVEKIKYKPYQLRIVQASNRDTVNILSSRMPYKDDHNEDRFRVLNALRQGEEVQSGELYKIIMN